MIDSPWAHFAMKKYLFHNVMSWQEAYSKWKEQHYSIGF